MRLWLPAEAFLKAFKFRLHGRLEIAVKGIADGHRMNHHAGQAFFGALLGCLPRDERGAIHHVHHEIVVAADGSFRKDNERASAGDKDLDRLVDALAIVPLTINTEGAHPTNHEPLVPALLEEMPTGHREEFGAHLL